MLLSCSVCGISDTVYRALNGNAIQCSFSSLNHHTVRSDGLFASLRCLIPKQRNRFEKLLELALIGECFHAINCHICLEWMGIQFLLSGKIWLWLDNEFYAKSGNL